MKVLLINGSPHKGGNTYDALSEVARTLHDEGIETEIAWIGNRAIRSCIACNMCKTKADGQCTFSDDICNTMIDKLRESDGIIVGSPVYFGVPNGGVLSLMQRMFYAAGSEAQNKPAAAVVICRRGGASASFQTLTMPFQMLNMPVVTSQYWNMVYGRVPGEAEQDAEGMQTMRTLAHNMAWMLRSLKREEVPAREQWQATNFIR